MESTQKNCTESSSAHRDKETKVSSCFDLEFFMVKENLAQYQLSHTSNLELAQHDSCRKVEC